MIRICNNTQSLLKLISSYSIINDFTTIYFDKFRKIECMFYTTLLILLVIWTLLGFVRL